MAGISGGALAAAVTHAGGLGFIGGEYGDQTWLTRELKAGSKRPPSSIPVRFGSVRPFSDQIARSLTRLIVQVLLRLSRKREKPLDGERGYCSRSGD